jgi:hypothetical protein
MLEALTKLADYMKMLLVERRSRREMAFDTLVQQPFDLVEEVYRDLLSITQGLQMEIRKNGLSTQTRDWLRDARMRKKVDRDKLKAIAELEVSDDLGLSLPVEDFYRSLVEFFSDSPRVAGKISSGALSLIQGGISASLVVRILALEDPKRPASLDHSELANPRRDWLEELNPIDAQEYSQAFAENACEVLNSEVKSSDHGRRLALALFLAGEAFDGNFESISSSIENSRYTIGRTEFGQTIIILHKGRGFLHDIKDILMRIKPLPYVRDLSYAELVSCLTEEEKIDILNGRATVVNGAEQWAEAVAEWVIETEQRICMRFARVAGAYYRVKHARLTGLFR